MWDHDSGERFASGPKGCVHLVGGWDLRAGLRANLSRAAHSFHLGMGWFPKILEGLLTGSFIGWEYFRASNQHKSVICKFSRDHDAVYLSDSILEKLLLFPGWLFPGAISIHWWLWGYESCISVSADLDAILHSWVEKGQFDDRRLLDDKQMVGLIRVWKFNLIV